MVERKRGHILAISSVLGYFPGVHSTIYTATKFGVRGFMQSLYGDLCIDNLDKEIRLTTVFPSFISTNKKVDNIVDSFGLCIEKLDPKFVAAEAVGGILRNKSEVHVPVYNKTIMMIHE